jgi:Ca2+/Na+ antiporter
MLGGYLDFLWLFLLGGVVILITRFLLIQGIQWASDAWEIPKKVQGQVLGYATSAPELVGTLGTASKGLIGAGLWNVAASNIINLLLFISAALYYKRSKTLVQRKFIDEAGFALGAIAFPCLLVLNEDFARSPYAAIGLFGYFISYLVLDRVFNPKVEDEGDDEDNTDSKKGFRGIALILLGLLGIVITGNYLGIVAESIVTQQNVPEWAVGWLLGLITSLPELTSFYAVFAASRSSDGDEDCQQNLDNLAASNMSNVGLIYPLGIMVYLFVS